MSELVGHETRNPDAHGRRHRVRATVRHTLRRVTRRLGRSFSTPLHAETQFLPLPDIEAASFGDFATRATWYLGSWTRSPRAALGTVSVPNYLDQSIDLAASERPFDQAKPTHHLVWKVTPRSYWRALAHPSTVTIVDPSFAKDIDTEGYIAVGRRLGLSVPSGLLASTLGGEADRNEASALVLGTGPSAGDVEGSHLDWTYRIVCNSAIRDRALMERLRPTHICFGDPVFHFGPSAYAAEFRRDLKKVAEEFDSALVIPSYCAALLGRNLAWAESRFIPLDLTSPHWVAPTNERPEVRITGNVLTQHMVPIAISIATAIDVGGADGRKSDETYFWSHSKAHQYSDDLMNTAFVAHPAFFRDTDYADYYAEHCLAVEELLTYGESRGCVFRTVTKSYIPALVKRMP